MSKEELSEEKRKRGGVFFLESEMSEVIMNLPTTMTKTERQIVEAKTVGEVKNIRDKLETLRRYVSVSGGKREEINEIAEAKVFAEWRGGKLLTEIPKKQGFAHLFDGRTNGTEYQAELVKAGLRLNMAHRWQIISLAPEEELHDYFEKTKRNPRGIITSDKVYRIGLAHRSEKITLKQRLISNPNQIEIRQSDVKNLDWISDESVDWIITDPPYPQEFLDTYGDLARAASRILKRGGSALVMAGQSYLPDVMERLTQHLNYHWTVAYLTPGGQASQIFPRRVNAFWKPIIWLTRGEYKGRWIGDVSRSDVNDNDKSHHHWGQSESGIADVIKRFTKPGELICDPFLGGGTTAIVATDLGRRFVGSDIDDECVQRTKKRLAVEI